MKRKLYHYQDKLLPYVHEDVCQMIQEYVTVTQEHQNMMKGVLEICDYAGIDNHHWDNVKDEYKRMSWYEHYVASRDSPHDNGKFIGWCMKHEEKVSKTVDMLYDIFDTELIEDTIFIDYLEYMTVYVSELV